MSPSKDARRLYGRAATADNAAGDNATEVRPMSRTTWIVIFSMLMAGAVGCTSGPSRLTMVDGKLKLVSAGFTGCVPTDNVLTNVAPGSDGSGTWNATCKGKVYLCSSVPTVKSHTFHCAPVAQ
jgi:hypothetical protein